MLTDHEFQRIVRYVKGRSGIDLSQKRVLVTGRLENYLIRNGYESYDAFMELVEKDPKGKESEQLINAVSTNHTYFMRESEHFEYLRKVVLPQIRQKEAWSRDLRIWSGASSTGEEPYALAMVIKDFFGLEYSQWDTRLLATDISTRVLQHALKGVYMAEQVQPLPERWLKSHFKQVDRDHYKVKDELKKAVIFRQFNLMNPFPFKKRFHVVFMRNVMIYFEEDVKYKIVEKVYDFMEPGGYLFIGTTEALNLEKTRFKFVQPSIYRK